MSLRPEILFVRSLLPRRSFLSRESRNAMTDTNTTLLMRAARWQIARRERAGRGAWPKRAVVVGVTLAVTAGTGIAVAAWTASGTGTAAAKAGTSSAVTGVTTTTTTSGTLVPGGSVPLVVNIHNPNTFPVTVTAVTVSAGAPTGTVVGAANSSGTCTNANSAITTTAVNATGLSIVVGAGGDNTYTTPTNVVSMATTSDNNCQSGTFTWSATVTATS